MPKDKPNIVLICVDQWRGDCLSIDNHPVVHTPYLDQLALEGCHFSRAYSATPSCIAARAALFTGLSQKSHGRVGYQDGVEWNYDTTLAGEFTRQGYQTQAIGKMHVYPERNQVGFQNVILHDGFLHFARKSHSRNLEMVDDYIPWLREKTGNPAADYFDHGINCNSVVARPWDKDEELHPTNFVASQGIDFLRRRDPTKPFMLYLSFHRPHPPYDPPEWAFNQYMDMEMPDSPVGDWADIWEGYENPNKPDSPRAIISKDLLKRAKAGYYGHMTHIDHQINRFVETLADYGLRENTWICFTSDHGELMGDHHLFRKTLPYEGSARIPLILSPPPGVDIMKKGITSSAPVELRDVMPTLLDCVGLEIPESIEGKSLISLVDQNQEVSAPWREYIHGEHSAFGQSIQWLTDGNEKYIWHSGTGIEQFFDLNKDPTELNDIAKEAEDKVALWRQRLIKELANREECFSDGKKLITGCQVQEILSFL